MFKRSLYAIAVATAVLVPGLAFAQVTIEERLASGQPLVVIAHKAVGGGAPENSLAGIQYAIGRGVDMVEIDVQKTGDGGYVLMHDATLRATTNAEDVFPEGPPNRDPGKCCARAHYVSDYTLEDIAQLRLRDPLGGDHPVPTLDEALELAEGRLLMFVELKNWDVETLVPLLKRHDTRNLLLWTQSDQRKLRNTAVAAGIGVGMYLPSAGTVGLDKALEFFGPSLKLIGASSFSALTPEFVAKAEALGVGIEVDTRFRQVLGPDGRMAPWLATALDIGAAAVWTRQPDALLGALGR